MLIFRDRNIVFEALNMKMTFTHYLTPALHVIWNQQSLTAGQNMTFRHFLAEIRFAAFWGFSLAAFLSPDGLPK